MSILVFSLTQPEMSFKIERADPDADFDRIIEMANAAYEIEIGDCGIAFKSTQRYDGPEGRREAQEHIPHMLVARDGGGDIVGCVKAYVENGVTSIGTLAVDPRCQGQGLARALLDRAESLAPISEMEVLSCRTDVLPMYRRRGYVVVGTLPVVARLPEWSLTRKDIEFLVLRKSRD